MNLNLNETIALISVLLPVLIPVGQYLSGLLLARLPMAQREALKEIGSTVVQGVEQQAKSGQITYGQRKAQATAAVMEIAKALGIKVNPSLVSLVIEAAVLELDPTNVSQQTTPAMAPLPVPGV